MRRNNNDTRFHVPPTISLYGQHPPTPSTAPPLMATTGVNDSYRNVRIDPNQARNVCYTVGDFVVIDFRLTFGWTGSPGNFGVMTSAAEHSHCNTDLSNVQRLPEGVNMVERVEVVDRWEVGDPKKSCEQGGEAVVPFPQDAICRRPRLHKSPAIGRGKISFNRVGLARIRSRTTFWAGRAGRNTYPSAKKSLNWNTTVEFLGFIINSHTLEI